MTIVIRKRPMMATPTHKPRPGKYRVKELHLQVTLSDYHKSHEPVLEKSGPRSTSSKKLFTLNPRGEGGAGQDTTTLGTCQASTNLKRLIRTKESKRQVQLSTTKQKTGLPMRSSLSVNDQTDGQRSDCPSYEVPLPHKIVSGFQLGLAYAGSKQVALETNNIQGLLVGCLIKNSKLPLTQSGEQVHDLKGRRNKLTLMDRNRISATRFAKLAEVRNVNTPGSRSVHVARKCARSLRLFSKSLVVRKVSQGESVTCDDPSRPVGPKRSASFTETQGRLAHSRPEILRKNVFLTPKESIRPLLHHSPISFDKLDKIPNARLEFAHKHQLLWPPGYQGQFRPGVPLEGGLLQMPKRSPDKVSSSIQMLPDTGLKYGTGRLQGLIASRLQHRSRARIDRLSLPASLSSITKKLAK